MRNSEHNDLVAIHSDLKTAIPKIYLNAQGEFIRFDGNGTMHGMTNGEVLQSLKPIIEYEQTLASFMAATKPSK